MRRPHLEDLHTNPSTYWTFSRNALRHIEKRQECDLAEVFQYDCNVHVDDDEECDDEIGDEVQYRHADVAAVAVRLDCGRGIITVMAIG